MRRSSTVGDGGRVVGGARLDGGVLIGEDRLYGEVVVGGAGLDGGVLIGEDRLYGEVVVGGAGLDAGDALDDVADRADVVVEIGSRADDRRAVVADLHEALGGDRLQSSTDDRKPLEQVPEVPLEQVPEVPREQVSEVVGAEGEETAVRRRPNARHPAPPSQQADLCSPHNVNINSKAINRGYTDHFSNIFRFQSIVVMKLSCWTCLAFNCL